MSDKNSLNEKYQKFEPDESSGITDEISEKKSKKEKKVKEPKPPKEKKVKEPKEPKPPKEKKVKEPKEPKPPKEKKVKEPKEPKPPKEKKVKEPKEPKPPKEKKEKKVKEPKPQKEKKHGKKTVDNPEALENAVIINAPAEEIELPAENTESAELILKSQNGRQREEIVFDSELNVNKKSKKEKKVKKVKEPKPPKEKKIKEKKEKKPHEPLGKKDYATIILSVIAVVLALCVGFFAYFSTRETQKKIELVAKFDFLGKIFPEYVANTENSGNSENKDKLSNIQIVRDGVLVNLIQTDFQRIFYGINTDYSVQYYQYTDNKMVPVKYTDSINLKVDMGSGIINVKMNYIKNGEYVSGVSVFTADNNDDSNYFYNLVIFKLTVLPSKYNEAGHALLLATTDKTALGGGDVLWTESFDVNLNDGSVKRFLSIVNRTIDSMGAGVSDFCMINKAGYTTASNIVPFITSREYPVGAAMQDVFVKNGKKETVLASGVYGKYVTVDSNKIIYLRKTTTGYDVIHNTDGEEKVVRSFYGTMQANYVINDKYILSKADGHLYNIATGKDYSLVGYSMSVDKFEVSPDGRYVVMMGTVNNAVDYQIHIFDLQTGEYAKFPDKNYAPHSTLCYIDSKTVLYTAIDPNQGYEYVVLDLEKAFN